MTDGPASSAGQVQLNRGSRTTSAYLKTPAGRVCRVRARGDIRDNYADATTSHGRNQRPRLRRELGAHRQFRHPIDDNATLVTPLQRRALAFRSVWPEPHPAGDIHARQRPDCKRRPAGRPGRPRSRPSRSPGLRPARTLSSTRSIEEPGGVQAFRCRWGDCCRGRSAGGSSPARSLLSERRRVPTRRRAKPFWASESAGPSARRAFELTGSSTHTVSSTSNAIQRLPLFTVAVSLAGDRCRPRSDISRSPTSSIRPLTGTRSYSTSRSTPRSSTAAA